MMDNSLKRPVSFGEHITIVEAATTAAVRQAQAIREQVFTEEQGIPRALDLDGHDAVSVHVLLYQAGIAAATGRLTVGPEGEGVLARIAVLPAYRGQGLGRRVVRALEALALREGVAVLSLHAHTHLVPFYRRLGYEAGPETVQAGPYPLIKMRKQLGDPADR